MIPGRDQSAKALVPDEEGEHPTEVAYAFDTTFLVEMHDDFRVRSGREPMPSIFKLAAQSLEVVNLPVEDDGDALILVVDRLVPGDQIDDAQTTMSESGDPTGRDIFTGAVGPAMSDSLPHCADGVQIDLSIRSKRYLAHDPAHDSAFLPTQGKISGRG